jgi:UDP-N-acetylmuramyl tripeptide synthase
VLLNLSRDQLDRYGEVRATAESWRDALSRCQDATVIANCDDPLIAWAASGARWVTWVAGGQDWHDDASVCPACGAALVMHPAGWRCSCGFARPTPDVEVDKTGRMHRDHCDAGVLHVQLPGVFNLENAAMAVTAAIAAGANPDAAAGAISTVSEVEGRYWRGVVRGRSVRLLLAKNPAGWSRLLDEVIRPDADLLIAVNAQAADGRDTSWLWDVPFEQLAGRHVTAAGERALDLAVRLDQGGVEADVARGDLASAIGSGAASPALEVIANYTAFREVLRSIAS